MVNKKRTKLKKISDNDKPKKSKIPEGKRFSKDYQPSSEAKSRGARKYWQYRKARQMMFEKLCNMKLPKKGEVNFWEEIIKKLQNMIFESEIDEKNDYFFTPNGTMVFKGNKLTAKDKADLILKLCKEFMPESKNLEIDLNQPIVVNIDKQDKDV